MSRRRNNSACSSDNEGTGGSYDAKSTLRDAADSIGEVKRRGLLDEIGEKDDFKKNSKEIWFTFPSKKMALVTLAFVLSSQILLGKALSKAIRNRNNDPEPLVTRWKSNVVDEEILLLVGPYESARLAAKLPPGSEVEAIRTTSTKRFLHVIRPNNGFVARKIFSNGKDAFTKIEDVPNEAVSPLMFEGWSDENKTPKDRFLYAPPIIVVAQQLWNAAQVFHFILLICLYFHTKDSSNEERLATYTLIVASIWLLPFSVYVISPGGQAFAFLSLITSGVAALVCSDFQICVNDVAPLISSDFTPNDDDTDIERNNAELSLSPIVNPNEARGPYQPTSFSTVSVHEFCSTEFLGFIGNLFCSLYNYNAGRTNLPWNRIFRAVDRTFGWIGANLGSRTDNFVEEVYTLGLEDVRVPLFVPRSNNSTFGSQVFLVIWAMLPLIYTLYFFFMYKLAAQSSGTFQQRLFCLYGMCSFLFFTDVVAYKFGRGFWSPHAELFHWFERFAWRIAVLLPIYQNVMTKHWKFGHYMPYVGTVTHYFMAVWALWFFGYQVLLSDIPRFPQFLQGVQQQSLLGILFDFKSFKAASYHTTIMLMAIAYAMLLLGGFSLHRIYICKTTMVMETAPSSYSSSALTSSSLASSLSAQVVKAIERYIPFRSGKKSADEEQSA